MKCVPCLLLVSLLLAACGKDEAVKPAASAPSAATPPPPAVAKKDTPADLKKLQGELPRMDPEKARFIAVASTPPNPAPPKSPEVKGLTPQIVPPVASKSAAAAEAPTSPNTPSPAPEVKKAAPAKAKSETAKTPAQPPVEVKKAAPAPATTVKKAVAP